MAIPFKKYGYKINPITDDIENPQIFLVNKKLEKLGELYPFEDLEIVINEGNQPDEVSFTYYKKANNQECPCFDKLNDLSVIQVGDFGFFECEIGKQDNASVSKTVIGKSLGFAELSQILHTLEVNTEDDIARTDYDKEYPTIFYRDIPIDADASTERKLCESSLLHRILTKVPHYKIGYVAPTLKHIQRTFSWSDTDIVSMLNDIAEEITCMFDIQVHIGDDGKAERLINVYDMQYCEKCWEDAKKAGRQTTSNTSHFRNIVNGVCQNCGSSKHISDIGEDSGIYISTEYLSDDIEINGEKDSIKNCFKITGGDDLITSTVQGLNMSATNRIIEFSDLQRKEMSDNLVERLDSYKNEYNSNSSDYEALLETEYNLHDIRLYLQSEKMPQIEKEITTTDEALYSVLSNIKKYFNNKFYISSYQNYYNYPSSSARTSIYNMFTTFMPEGYTLTIDKSNTEEDMPSEQYNPDNSYKWYGNIKFNRTGDRDDFYTLYITKKNGTYVTSGNTTEHYISSNKEYQDLVDKFQICFYFADQSQQEYKNYLERYTAYLLTTVSLSYENEKKKEWDKYSHNLLQSYRDGYRKCIDTIDEMIRTNADDTGAYKILSDMRRKYVSICNDISLQMNVLEDQIFAVCYYLGGDYNNNYLNDKGDVVYNYKFYKGNNKADIQDIFNRMTNPKFAGGYNEKQTNYTPNEYIGNKPFKCLKCNSSNVAVSTEGNICRNPGCGATGEYIYTYCDIMENIAKSYETHNGRTVSSLRTEYQKRFDMRTYFGEELYTEMCSFIREDVYNNNNFTSDGLSNSQIIQQAKELQTKAKQELAKACRPQYEVTAPLCSIVAQIDSDYSNEEDSPYSQFKINNYVRVRIDKDLYKMRITSFRLQFPISDKIDVTFSNVSNCKTNTAQEVKDILDNAVSIATNISYVATQAEKGEVVSTEFSQIKEEGLNAALVSVKNSCDQDVVIDSHGILLRKKIQETGEYSNYQMKLIDRNIVLTDDGFQSAKLAIGLGMYNGKPVYGIWTELFCGNLLVGEKLNISNDNGSVEITGDGIVLDGGAITWKKKLPSSSIIGLDETLNTFVSKTVYNQKISDLQKQIDGNITTWFYDYLPTTTNKPASDWKTDEEKITHEGDLFYCTDSNNARAYRYVYNDSTKQHEWLLIEDTDVTKALADAAKAQDTADNKRRVFVVEPKPPYDIGDLWVQGSSGDIMKCKVAKTESQSYSESDWEKASKYTNDDALITFINGDYKKALENINTQIDGKADTFYQSTQPHPKYVNVPSNSTYDLYVGDLWYNTTDGKSYMYQKVANGSNFDYTWKFMNVPQDVYDKIDGVASIYVTLPSNPNVGDLLIPNSDISGTNYKEGKVYKYNGSTWDEIKYTDDSAWKSWTSDTGEFGKYKNEIKKQIDGKSNCTYGGATPPSNPEAGDLWFCTDGSGGYDANKAYMYNGTSWKESNGVPDSVWDIADGKSSIFVVKPENPLSDVDSHCYYKGDIWILESNMTLNDKEYKEGSIMTSTSDSTEFIANHWVEKVRYTDDTKADKVEESLKAYKEEIANFQEQVNNSFSTLNHAVPVTQIGSDYVISPKMAAQYLYVTKDNYSVEIDPSHSAGDNTLNGYLFAIRDKSKSDNDQVIMGVDTNGNGYVSGKIKATSGTIGGWSIKQDGIYYGYEASTNSFETGLYTKVPGTNYSGLLSIASTYTSGIQHGEYASCYAGMICAGSLYSDTYTPYVTISKNGINVKSTNGSMLDINSEQNSIILGTNSTDIDLNGNSTFYKNMYISPNYYLYSTQQYNGINISMLGMNDNRGLYLGMYYYDGSHHPDYLNSIILSSKKTEVLGTLIAKDGTVVTSDARYKTDINKIEQKEVDFILGLTPKKFKLADGTSGRYHYGFIAQEVETLMDKTIGDVGLLVKREAKPEEADDYVPIDFSDEETFQYGLRYEEFIAPMVKTIQHLNKEIKELKKELSTFTAYDTND